MSWTDRATTVLLLKCCVYPGTKFCQNWLQTPNHLLKSMDYVLLNSHCILKSGCECPAHQGCSAWNQLKLYLNLKAAIIRKVHPSHQERNANCCKGCWALSCEQHVGFAVCTMSGKSSVRCNRHCYFYCNAHCFWTYIHVYIYTQEHEIMLPCKHRIQFSCLLLCTVSENYVKIKNALTKSFISCSPQL